MFHYKERDQRKGLEASSTLSPYHITEEWIRHSTTSIVKVVISKDDEGYLLSATSGGHNPTNYFLNEFLSAYGVDGPISSKWLVNHTYQLNSAQFEALQKNALTADNVKSSAIEAASEKRAEETAITIYPWASDSVAQPLI